MELQSFSLDFFDLEIFKYSVWLAGVRTGAGLTIEQQEHEVVRPLLPHYFLNLICAFLLIWQLNGGPTCLLLCAEAHTYTHTGQSSLHLDPSRLTMSPSTGFTKPRPGFLKTPTHLQHRHTCNTHTYNTSHKHTPC